MPNESGASLAHRYVDEFINRQNLALVEDWFTPDVTFHDPGAPGGVAQGIDAAREFAAAVFAAFPDLKFTILEEFAAGDRVAWRGTAEGTQNGPFGPLPPSGKRISIPLAEFYHLENGKIATAWVLFDSAELLRQLGAVPGQG